jgi:hypothetical protein
MNIIESHRKRSAKHLYDNGAMYDFLPIINPHSRKDMSILNSWCHHLAEQNIPYLVELGQRMCQDYVERDNIILWKEKRV